MAIPIRLLTSDGNHIDVITQSFDISVDRNVTAFPTPDNFLKRFSVDTNIPQIKIDMAGVFMDDEGMPSTASVLSSNVSPMGTVINLGSMLPTTSESNFAPITTAYAAEVVDTEETDDYTIVRETGTQYTLSPFITGAGILYENTVTQFDAKMKAPANLVAAAPADDPQPREIAGGIDLKLKFQSGYTAGVTGPFSVETTVEFPSGTALTIADNPDLGADEILRKGDRLVTGNGLFIGIVDTTPTTTSFTLEDPLANTVVGGDTIHASIPLYTGFNQFVGYIQSMEENWIVSDDPFWTITLIDKNETVIKNGNFLHGNRARPLEGVLHNSYIKIVPSYWLEDPSRNPKGGLVNNDMLSAAYSAGANHIGIIFRFNKNKVNSLWGGLSGSTVKRKASEAGVNTNLPPVDAYSHSAIIDVPIRNLDSQDNPAVALATALAAAFDIAGDITDHASKKIHPDGDTLPDAFTVIQKGPTVTILHNYHPESGDILHPNPFSNHLQSNFRPEVYHKSSRTPVEGRKSAGDKVQDLIGIVSNSSKHSGDLITGIQIPYDSLITSSGVTGVTRNFFLTFGELPIGDKGSLVNERAASDLMNELSLLDDVGGRRTDEPKNLFDEVVSALIPDVVESLVGFLASAAKDLWVTLDTTGHGNDGGMRVIPDKLHVRYDAGNKYYAFNLQLLAADFVIGV